MKKLKTLSAILLTAVGGIVCAVGALALFVWADMVIKEISDNKNPISTILAGVVLIFVFAIAGVLPLVKGINALRGKQKSEDLIISSETTVIEKPKNAVKAVEPEKAECSHIICRDKQFDNGDKPVIFLLLKLMLCAVVPLTLAIVLSFLLSKSVGGNIRPNTWQAWTSLMIIIVFTLIMVLSFRLCAKYNAIGNKFYYYIIDDKKGLSFAHMAKDNLAYFTATKATALEKIKSSPSPLYMLLYILNGKNRVLALRLARMQMYFKVNQKHGFVENLLQSEQYEDYTYKIVGVRKIKYFSKGCEVTLVYMSEGVEQVQTQIIYRNTENYSQLLDKLKSFITDRRIGHELSGEQVGQIHLNMYRRFGITLLMLVILILLVILGIYGYIEASYKASIAGIEGLKMAWGWLAARRKRRIIRIFWFVILVVMAVIGKLISDIILVDRFTYTADIKILHYYRAKGKWYRRLLGDYKYFAKIQYGDTTVDVGMSKKMWDKKDSVEPVLALRKNVPYCIISF